MIVLQNDKSVSNASRRSLSKILSDIVKFPSNDFGTTLLLAGILFKNLWAMDLDFVMVELPIM